MISPATSFRRRFALGLWFALLVFLLVLPGVLGSLASLFALIAALLSLLLAFDPERAKVAARQPLVAIFLAAFCLLSIILIVTAESPGEALNVFNFIPFFLALPVFILACIAGPNVASAVATACLLGALAATAHGLIDISIFGYGRAGRWLSNENVYGRASLLLGFLAPIGYFNSQSCWRVVFWTGPFLGTLAMIMSGSRGAFLALPFLILISLYFLITSTPRKQIVMAALGLTALVGAIAIAILLVWDSGRFIGIAETAWSAITGTGKIDSSTEKRLLMYDAGLEAFLNRPWLGHGWGNLINAAAAYMTPDQASYALRNQNHLHNDPINFAVGAGLPGILAYAALLTAPLIQLFATPPDRRNTAAKYGTAVLVATYLITGQFNMSLGYDLPTTMYAFIAALLCASLQLPAARVRGRLMS